MRRGGGGRGEGVRGAGEISRCHRAIIWAEFTCAGFRIYCCGTSTKSRGERRAQSGLFFQNFFTDHKPANVGPRETEFWRDARVFDDLHFQGYRARIFVAKKSVFREAGAACSILLLYLIGSAGFRCESPEYGVQVIRRGSDNQGMQLSYSVVARLTTCKTFVMLLSSASLPRSTGSYAPHVQREKKKSWVYNRMQRDTM